MRSVISRPGQKTFRQELLDLWDSTCCLSGWKDVEALEAAHIQEVKDERNDQSYNGLLLRVDLHRLFDSRKVGACTIGFCSRFCLSFAFPFISLRVCFIHVYV